MWQHGNKHSECCDISKALPDNVKWKGAKSDPRDKRCELPIFHGKRMCGGPPHLQSWSQAWSILQNQDMKDKHAAGLGNGILNQIPGQTCWIGTRLPLQSSGTTW